MRIADLKKHRAQAIGHRVRSKKLESRVQLAADSLRGAEIIR
jgi:hypothetical protein